jgi:tetratricopeptide (TPR) repeat protein
MSSSQVLLAQELASLLESSKRKRALKVLKQLIGSENKSTVEYLLENYETAFTKYYNEQKIDGLVKLPKDLSYLSKRDIVVVASDDIPQTILLCRFISYIVDMGASVTFVVHSDIKWLLKESFQDINVVHKLPDKSGFKYIIPLACLPILLSVNEITYNNRYLSANYKKIEKYYKSNDIDSNMSNIGIFISQDTIDPTALEPIVKLKSSQLAIHIAKKVDSFDEVLFFANSMDVVITDNSLLAHICGACGIRCYMFISGFKEWVWGVSATSTKWYPKVKIFRETPRGWLEAILLLKLELLKNFKISSIDISYETSVAKSLYENSDIQQSIKLYKYIAQIDKNSIDVQFNYAMALFYSQQYVKARTVLDHIVSIDNYHEEAHTKLGDIYIKQKEYSKAKFMYNQAYKINPSSVEVIASLALLYDKMNKKTLSKEYFVKALNAKPNDAYIMSKYAALLESCHEFDKAEHFYKQALLISPTNALIHYRYGKMLLSFGEYEKGWREYEWYHKSFTPCSSLKQWRGENLDNKSLLICTQQCTIDHLIIFARYIDMLKVWFSVKVLVDSKKSRAKLLSYIDSIDEIVQNGKKVETDFYCSICSLPGLFNTTLANIPNKIPYFNVASKKYKYLKDDSKKSIGIFFDKGSQITKKDINKLIANNQAYRLYSLNKKFSSSENSFISLVNSKKLHKIAKALKYLDLVIAVESPIAYLSASLGIPTWVILGESPGFIWLNDKKHSPWYDNVEIYKKESTDKWSKVLALIEKDLYQLK